jgi:hypothetical protein
MILCTELSAVPFQGVLFLEEGKYIRSLYSNKTRIHRVLQCRITTCTSGIPAIPKVETKVGLEYAHQPPIKYAEPSGGFKLYGPASQLGGSRVLKQLRGSLALTGEPRRKAALPREPKLPYPIR